MSDRDERENSNDDGERREERRDEEDRREQSPERRDRDNGDDNDNDRRGGEDRREDKPRDGPTTSLLVRNISYNLRSEDVKKLFSEFGEIRDVYIPNDYYTKKPKGFAFVEFFNHDEAMRALERMDRHPLDGRELAVEVAKDRRKTPDEMRPKGGRQRGADYGRGGGRDYGRGGPSYDRGDRGDRGGPGGYERRGDYPPRDYDRGAPYDHDRAPHRADYGYGRGRDRSRSRDNDRGHNSDYRQQRPDFRGREDRFYGEPGRGPPPARPSARSRSGSRDR